jgi:hypothetical protein
MHSPTEFCHLAVLKHLIKLTRAATSGAASTEICQDPKHYGLVAQPSFSRLASRNGLNPLGHVYIYIPPP